MLDISVQNLLEAGVHFGHQTNRWNPKMKPYIYGEYERVYILDLNKTRQCLKKAADFITHRVSEGDKVVFVGTKKQAQPIVLEEAKRCGAFYVCYRWLGGTFTNFRTIRSSVDRLKNIKKMKADGVVNSLTKKEALLLEREMGKLERSLGGVEEMKKLPNIIVIVDPNKEKISLKESQRMGVTVVALVDTNCNPDGIDFVVPGNDDAIKSIRLFVNAMAEACITGNAIYQKLKQETKAPKTDSETPPKESIETGSTRTDLGVEVVVKGRRPHQEAVK